MPEIKSYEGKKKAEKHAHNTHNQHPHHKRRHHHEAAKEGSHDMTDTKKKAKTTADEQMADIREEQAINTEAQNEGISADEMAAHNMDSEGGHDEHTEAGEHSSPQVEFYGSEIIRSKAPKVMEFADTVVDEWNKDGQFQDLPISHPLAQIAAGKALRKAKDVEKKLEEAGVFAMAKMGVEYVKTEINKRKKH